jgi:Uma2 family endonuclease
MLMTHPPQEEIVEAVLETFPQHIRRRNTDEFDRLMEIGLIAMRAYELMDGIVYNTSGFPRHWSLRDYELMVKAGLLTWEEHAELVDGYIVNLPCALAVQSSIRCRSHAYLYQLLGDPILFSGAGHSIVFDDANLACPDFSALRWKEDRYRDAWPRAQDVFAIMDVSVEPLIAETNARVRQFARFHVPEFWHLDGKADTVTLYRSPENSEYQDVRAYGHGEVFRSDALGGLTIPVDELIGPEWDCDA